MPESKDEVIRVESAQSWRESNAGSGHEPVPDEKISYIGLLPTFMDISFATYTRMLTSPFQRSKSYNYRRDVSYALLREIVSGFNVAEGQKFTPNTDKAYKKVAKSERWKEHTINLGGGAKAHWLGPPDARYVMVYFHGGGYINAATYGHLKYQFALQKAVRELGHDFSIISLSYTLAPRMVYPGQIGQAASAIRYLLEVQHRDPSTIIIGGDSAGGNLAAALLLHIAHPHPRLRELNLDKPLRAAVMISPWVCFRTNLPSFTKNKNADYLTPAALDRASNTYIGPGGRHDFYSEPRRAPVEWWGDVSRKSVKQVFIWGGGGEVLIDGIKDFAARMHHGFHCSTVGRAIYPELSQNGHAVGPASPSAIRPASPSAILPTSSSNANAPSLRSGRPTSPSAIRPTSPSARPQSPATHETVSTPRPDSEALPRGDAFAESKSRIDLGEFDFELELPHCATCQCNLVRTSKGKSRDSREDPYPDVRSADRVTFVETPRMGHEEMIVDYVLYIGGKREGAKVVEGWMDQILKG